MKVSIIITCYNYAHYLPFSLSSAVEQTYNDTEIVIVNDGSTDNIEEVLKPYFEQYEIKYIKKSNSGQANSKNVGISNSTGELIAFLDADDYWDKTKPVDFDVDIKSEVTYFALDKELSKKVRTIANQRGITSETLLNLWIKEKVPV